jgi:hypothetical protein
MLPHPHGLERRTNTASPALRASRSDQRAAGAQSWNTNGSRLISGPSRVFTTRASRVVTGQVTHAPRTQLSADGRAVEQQFSYTSKRRQCNGRARERPIRVAPRGVARADQLKPLESIAGCWEFEHGRRVTEIHGAAADSTLANCTLAMFVPSIRVARARRTTRRRTSGWDDQQVLQSSVAGTSPTMSPARRSSTHWMGCRYDRTVHAKSLSMIVWSATPRNRLNASPEPYTRGRGDRLLIAHAYARAQPRPCSRLAHSKSLPRIPVALCLTMARPGPRGRCCTAAPDRSTPNGGYVHDASSPANHGAAALVCVSVMVTLG